MESKGPRGRVTRSPESAELELALLDGAKELAGSFVCPDCHGDPACPTCGRPSRSAVGASLFGLWLRWAA